MEDVTDFVWQNAKAAHAVLLCETVRGTVCWTDTDHIDRIRRAHAQKHVAIRQNWGRGRIYNENPGIVRLTRMGHVLIQKTMR